MSESADEIRQKLFDAVPHMRTARTARNGSKERVKIGAVLVKSGHVRMTGRNCLGKSVYAKRNPHVKRRHAEERALRVSRDIRNVSAVSGGIIYVYREHGKTGFPIFARPCALCQELLRLAGVRKAVYTISESPYYAEMKL